MNEPYLNSIKNTSLPLKPSRTIRLLLMVLFVYIFSNVASAQSISATTYPVSSTAGVGLVPYTSLGTLIGQNSSDDDRNSGLANIGFNFWFNGSTYTQFGVSENGYLRLGTAPTAAGSTYTNNLSNGADSPKIAPFWDDLTMGTDGYVRYGLNGTAPNRTLVVEWKSNLWVSAASNSRQQPATMVFQLILSETTGRIQFIYGPGMITLPGVEAGYSIGLASSATNSASIATATNTATYGSDPNSTQTTAISSGRSYTFTPVIPTAPTFAITQPTCSVATASVVLNGLPTGSWELTRTPGSVITTGSGTSTTITGLGAGTTYTYSVNSLTNGLKGEYFNNMTLAGSPVLTLTDATVNMNWGSGSPDASINTNGFSARWSGYVEPQYSETYTFSTNSDDGTRLWINGVQILNNWINQAATNRDSTPIVLVAGQRYSIVLEYYENTGQASSRLLWRSPSQTSEIIPTTRLFSTVSLPSSASSSIAINAQPLVVNNISTGFSSSSFCSGNQATITFDADNGSGVFPYILVYRNETTSANATVTIPNDDATTFNIIPNPTATTNYILVSITDANGCVRTSSFGDSTARATINSVLDTPIVGSITQPDCVTATGSVVLSGLPAGNWTINPVGINGNTSSTTISGLAVGTHNFTVSNGSCPSSATANVVINPSLTNTWTGVWSQGTPNDTQKIVFEADYSSTGNVTACSCMVTSGTVVFNSGHALTLTNELEVTPAGSLTFQNTASLVQINTATNTGNIIYKRTTPSLIETDYTYWSTPVSGQTLNISPDYASGTFYSFDSAVDNWQEVSLSTSMETGRGYIMRGQRSNNDAYTITSTFTGIPNNGLKTIAVGPIGNSVLLGNPYPSALDAESFLDFNASILEGTIYFWTHKTAIQAVANIINGTQGSGAFAYTSDDYAAYNAVGGVGVGSGSASPSGSSLIPSGKIASGQGFFGTSLSSAGLVTFNNNMRVGVGGITGNNSQFFKTKSNTKKNAETIEKHRVWLNLSNNQGAFKQTLLGYVTNATNQYDNRFDGESFDGNSFIDFYSINDNKNLVIQGRSLPFDENDEVPLGFKSTIIGSFSISIDQVDGLMTNQDIFIEDKLTNAVTNLKTANYTFNTHAGTFNDRFVLRYANKTTLGRNDFETHSNAVLVSIKNKQLKINSTSESINQVVVYDLLGRQIYQKDKVDRNELLITDFVSTHQTLLVKTVLQSGTTVTKKVIY
jgi:hypothetical protein